LFDLLQSDLLNLHAKQYTQTCRLVMKSRPENRMNYNWVTLSLGFIELLIFFLKWDKSEANVNISVTVKKHNLNKT
jgi:hypothetical protein